ncbi:HD domain-containing protein [Anaerocolumna jejuensis]|uniref:HD domain-containing protein n=1 Tax=Anaerocolumna jejuensis TaxID=259063 RepID=UPI003F7B3EDC
MILTPKEAEKELKIAEEMNPGAWIGHSESVGKNAGLIAERIEHMDRDAAYAMGLLHDIGRREGFKSILHTLDGYNYMTSLGQKEIARICLTHSFPQKDINTFLGKFDCTMEEKAFIADYLQKAEYDDYDRLIQLCDAISLPEGACIMEKRLLDVAMRHGVPDFTIDKWKAFLNLKKYFDGLCGCNIYDLLPNVVENSFRDLV